MDAVVKRRGQLDIAAAKSLHARICKGITTTTQHAVLLRELVWEYDDGGWQAMGFSSLGDAFEKQLCRADIITKRHMYRLRARGKIVAQLSLTGGFSETALDEISKADPDERLEVWRDAKLLAGINPVSASIAQKAVNRAKRKKKKAAEKIQRKPPKRDNVRVVDTPPDQITPDDERQIYVSTEPLQAIIDLIAQIDGCLDDYGRKPRDADMRARLNELHKVATAAILARDHKQEVLL